MFTSSRPVWVIDKAGVFIRNEQEVITKDIAMVTLADCVVALYPATARAHEIKRLIRGADAARKRMIAAHKQYAIPAKTEPARTTANKQSKQSPSPLRRAKYGLPDVHGYADANYVSYANIWNIGSRNLVVMSQSVANGVDTIVYGSHCVTVICPDDTTCDERVDLLNVQVNIHITGLATASGT